MEEFKLKVECTNCKGEGVVAVGSEGDKHPCPNCGGDGYEISGTIDGAQEIDWIKKKIKKILNKLEIPEE